MILKKMYNINMSQNKLIVSNWKMNLNLISAKKLINKLKKIKFTNKYIKNIVCPQFLLIPLVTELIKSSNISLGAQDCHFIENGSSTGDSSITLIKKYGCKYVIIGHSERRNYHHEDNNLVKKKLILANKYNISPILCIGESLEVRKSNSYLNFLNKQLEECIPENLKKIIIAYEPIWSIGTGETPTNEDIQEIHKYSSTFLNKKKNITNLTFLYGGSVNSKNSSDIIKGALVDGLLIGGASIQENEITKILNNQF